MPSPNYIANGNISPMRFVTFDTTTGSDNKVLQCGTNGQVAGIAQEGGREAPLPVIGSTMYAGKAGDCLTVYGEGDTCLLELGGTVTQGNYLKSDTNGCGVAITTTGTTAQQVGAYAMGNGVSGEKIRVQVRLIPKVYPALA